MQLQELFQSIADRGNARTVFGEPITAHGKTIVPVARIAYGFGGGSDQKPGEPHEGFGGGGGLSGKPVGVVEISAAGTRFIPIHRKRAIAIGLGIGFCLGLLAGRKKAAHFGVRPPDRPVAGIPAS